MLSCCYESFKVSVMNFIISKYDFIIYLMSKKTRKYKLALPKLSYYENKDFVNIINRGFYHYVLKVLCMGKKRP